MKKRNFKTDELDRIGRKLLDAGKTQREEIERIVASPTLFATVKTRIEIERRERNSQSVFGGWTSFLILNRQRVSAALLLFAVAAIGIVSFNKFAARQQLEQAAAPEIQPKIEPIKSSPVPPPDRILEDSSTVATVPKVKNSAAGKSSKFIKQTALADNGAKARKPARQRKFEPRREKPAGEFYALAFAGNSAENGEPLRVVRAELSRSSLFALGVNISIDNDAEKIKTDLLVSADGVARAIRFVN
jgi:hypothetical protein